ncbi:MAG: NYN domain-containing protein [Planctomycetes bacterium]|nr:NYN domain-containing protein [Planctomycetota bacterium]
MPVDGSEHHLAVFVDLENVAIGVREAKYGSLEIDRVLARLVEKGKISVKKAYADWSNFKEYKLPFHEAAIELIDIPHKKVGGKNSADIKMVVDALELSYTKSHIDTFALVTGDSDFSPLVSKLRENNKMIIGVGVKNSTSDLLMENCDEFIFYDDLVRKRRRGKKQTATPKFEPKEAEAFNLTLESILALLREDKDVLWASMVKQTIKRKRPSFNEEYHGFPTFSKLLEAMQKHKLIKLSRDPKSRTYIVEELLEEAV